MKNYWFQSYIRSKSILSDISSWFFSSIFFPEASVISLRFNVNDISYQWPRYPYDSRRYDFITFNTLLFATADGYGRVNARITLPRAWEGRRSGIQPARRAIACKNLSLDRVPVRATSRSCPTFQKLVSASSAARMGAVTVRRAYPFAWIDFRIVQRRAHFRRYRLGSIVENRIFWSFLLCTLNMGR